MVKYMLAILCIVVLLWTHWGLYIYSKDKRILPACLAMSLLCLIGVACLLLDMGIIG